MTRPRRKVKSRKGEERARLLAALANPVPPGGTGPRVVQLPGHLVALDPANYCCSLLAMQLADEWVEYVAATEIGSQAKNYRHAIDHLCQYVDKALGVEAAGASLADPGLFDTLVRWELSLPEEYDEGSTRPWLLASSVRVLVIRRDDHDERTVAADLARLARGPALLGSGESKERDEFTRKEKLALVRAAWTSAHATRKRIEDSWALAAQGRHPDQGAGPASPTSFGAWPTKRSPSKTSVAGCLCHASGRWICWSSLPGREGCPDLRPHACNWHAGWSHSCIPPPSTCTRSASC